MSRGVVYIVTEQSGYLNLLNKSLDCTTKFADVHVLSDIPHVTDRCPTSHIDVPKEIRGYKSRWLKTQLPLYSPFDQTLYLDSDAVVLQPLDELWEKTGLFLALDIHPTIGQGLIAGDDDHKGSAKERKETADVCLMNNPYYNGGVIYYTKDDNSDAFFKGWHEEWFKYQNVDQFALVRAIAKKKSVVNTLSHIYNYNPKMYKGQLPEEIIIAHYWTISQREREQRCPIV